MKLLKGFIVSALVHSMLFAGGYGYVARLKGRPAAAMDIDLRHSSWLLRPPQTGGHLAGGVRAGPWYVISQKKPARLQHPRRPAQAPAPLETPEEPDADAAGCPAGEASGPGGDGNWLLAGAVFCLPEWVDGFITEEDYPAGARKEGKEGQVTAMVAIDAAGSVREVQITEKSFPEFNQVVQERLKSARFKPGRDRNGRPVAVRMLIPVVFQLH